MRYAVKNQSGFTLLETIVAIFILSLAVVGFLSVMTRGISIGSYAKDEMIASFLAQDAMEYIRAKKNENILQAPGVSWLDGTRQGGAPCDGGESCGVDTTVESLPGPQYRFIKRCTQLPTNGCALWYNTNSGAYGHNNGAGWIQTKFGRTVTMNEIVDNREVQVVVTVSFPQGNVTKSTVFYQNMYNNI